MGKIKYNEDLMVEFITKLNYSMANTLKISSDVNDSINSIPREIKNKVDYLCSSLTSDIEEYSAYQDLLYARILWSHNLIKSNDDYLGNLFDRLNENIDSIFHSTIFDESAVYDDYDNFFSVLSCDEREKLFKYAYEFFDKLHRKIKENYDKVGGCFSFVFTNEEEIYDFYKLFQTQDDEFIPGSSLFALASEYGYKIFTDTDENGNPVLYFDTELYDAIISGDIFQKTQTDYNFSYTDDKKNLILEYFQKEEENLAEQMVYNFANELVYESSRNLAQKFLFEKKQLYVNRYKYVFDEQGNQVKDENGRWKISEDYIKAIDKVRSDGKSKLLTDLPGVKCWDSLYREALLAGMTEKEAALLYVIETFGRQNLIDNSQNNPVGDFVNGHRDFVNSLIYKNSSSISHKLALRYLDNLSLGEDTMIGFLENTGEVINQFAVGTGDGIKAMFDDLKGWLSEEEIYYYDDPSETASDELWRLLVSIEHDPTGKLTPVQYSKHLNELAYANGEIDEQEYNVMKKIYSCGETRLQKYRDLYKGAKKAGKAFGGLVPTTLLKLAGVPSGFILGLSMLDKGGSKVHSEVKAGASKSDALRSGAISSGIYYISSSSLFKYGTKIANASTDIIEDHALTQYTENLMKNGVKLISIPVDQLSKTLVDDTLQYTAGFEDTVISSDYMEKAKNGYVKKFETDLLSKLWEGVKTMRVIK